MDHNSSLFDGSYFFLILKFLYIHLQTLMGTKDSCIQPKKEKRKINGEF